jgi:hypothetical protein
MAFLLELPSLAEIGLRIDHRKTEIAGDLRPVQSQTI